MYRTIRTLIAAAAVGLALHACSADSDVAVATDDNVVTFSAPDGHRAVGTRWDAGDVIGVYMKTAGQAFDNSSLTGANANVSYATAAGDGYFTPTATALAYPAGSAVDFVAYYPYNANVSNGVLTLDIANRQDTPAAIDLLYADNLKNVSRTQSAQALAFRHCMASVTINLSADATTTCDGISVSLAAIPTRGKFDLAAGIFTEIGNVGNLPMRVVVSGSSATATALVFPQAEADYLLAVVTLANGSVKTVVLSESQVLESGKNYAYTLRLTDSSANKGDAEATGYARWTETPRITAAQMADANLRYVTHSFTTGGKTVRNYSMLYDTNLKMAYWVAYPLCNFYTRSNVSRTDAWGFDPQFGIDEQANMTKGIPGYDRGHQLPSADRLVSTEANQQTFYFTNMTAQVGKLNQQIWAELESKARNWSSNIDTLYVVTGAMPSLPGSTAVKYTNDNDGKRIAVPAYYFKAFARIDRQSGTAYTIAFTFKNEAFTGSSFMDQAISVSALEEMTGFTFFPSIDAQYKAAYDATKWN